MLQIRIADHDERPPHAGSFEAALKDALLKEFPVAAIVEQVDPRFVHLLETMAALDLNSSLKDQPEQGSGEMCQASTCKLTNRSSPNSDRLSRAA